MKEFPTKWCHKWGLLGLLKIFRMALALGVWGADDRQWSVVTEENIAEDDFIQSQKTGRTTTANVKITVPPAR